jgi:hypothetical protein
MTTRTDDRPIAKRPVPAPWSTWTGVAVIGVLGAIVAIAIVMFAINGDATGSPSLDARRIAATGTACDQWLASTPTAASMPGSSWCAGMAGWMSDQLTTGRMTGPRLWNSPQSMVDACSQWAASASAQCGRMVTWMSQHMGAWDSWHDWDAHMGSWGSGMMSR